MKKSKALSALIAAMMITGMAVSVNAADYAVNPGYTPPVVTSPVGKPTTPPTVADSSTPPVSKGPSGPSNSGRPVDSVSSSSGTQNNNTSSGQPTEQRTASTVTSRAVAVALEKGTPIKIHSAIAAIKSNSLAQLAKVRNGVLKFTANRFTAEIEASSVIDAKNIDIGLAITKNTSHNALILKTRQKGDFGCTVKYSIPLKIYSQAGVDLSKVSLYLINRRTGVAELYSPVEIDKDGNIVFEIYEGGTYVIL